MRQYISLALVVLAALFKSVADTLDDHFSVSIFRHLNPKVWDANYSEVKAWWITGYKLDPWHISNSLMIICFIAAVVFHARPTWRGRPLPWWLEILILGAAFNIIFGLFYSKIWV